MDFENNKTNTTDEYFVSRNKQISILYTTSCVACHFTVRASLTDLTLTGTVMGNE